MRKPDTYPGLGLSVVMMGLRPSFFRFLVPEAADAPPFAAAAAPAAAAFCSWAPFIVHGGGSEAGGGERRRSARRTVEPRPARGRGPARVPRGVVGSTIEGSAPVRFDSGRCGGV